MLPNYVLCFPLVFCDFLFFWLPSTEYVTEMENSTSCVVIGRALNRGQEEIVFLGIIVTILIAVIKSNRSLDFYV